MANDFVRSIKNVRNINKQPLNTNEQTDLLSDDKDVYVRNKDKYENLTNGVKSVNNKTVDENGNVNVEIKDFTGQEKFVRKNELDEALEDIHIDDRNLLLNSSSLLTRWKEYKGTNYSAKQVDMTEEWGTENAYEFSISGGTDRYKILYGTSEYVSEPMVFDRKYTYSIFVKNTGKNPFEFYVNRLLNPETLENQSIQIEPEESKRISLTGVRSKDYNSFQPMVRTRTDYDLKVIMAMEKIQKGKPTGWTPAPEDLVDEAKKYTDSQMNGLDIPTDYNQQITITPWQDITIKNDYTASDTADFKPSYCVVDYGSHKEVFIRFGFENLIQSKNVVGSIPSELVPYKMYRNGTTTVSKIPPKIIIITSGDIEIHQNEHDEYTDTDYVIYEGSWIIHN